MDLGRTFSPAGIFIVLLFFMTPAAICARDDDGVYHIQTMGELQVTLPPTAASGDVLYRTRDGWVPLDTRRSDGALHFTISSDDLCHGSTTVTASVPPWVNLQDSGPPEVVKVSIDGRRFDVRPRLDIGGVATCPQTISIEIADADNWLRTKSYEVNCSGRTFRPSDPPLTLEKMTPHRSRLHLDVPAVIGELRPINTIVVSADDWALDSEALNFAVVFRHIEPHTLSDGTELAVDSVTDNKAWADWTVVADGRKMDSSGGTTAGKTWLSEENDAPHWIVARFPGPRTVTAVKIWWAYWNHFHTSRHYNIQAWDGDEWTDLLTVTSHTHEQCSHHEVNPVVTECIRVWQPPEGGNADEKRHMWISELEIFGPQGRLVPPE
ncbi:MAG: discoidin domain-containing protein [Armatimonadota bacterium]